MTRILSVFLFTLFLANNTFGQKGKPGAAKAPFVLGVTDKIRSLELKETRELNIYLPEGYNQDSAVTYPVIYLLDGSAKEDFIHITGITQFLTMINAIPASVVVGIANKDRKRDFTFPTTVAEDKKDFPTTGSSQAFIAFIEKELQPFIQKNYKVNNTKTIIGQSLGGLLATEILLKKPDLFDQYLIVSPSLWWDNESLLAAAPKLLEKQKDKKLKVYLSVGSEGKQMEDDAAQLASLLRSSGKEHLVLNFLPLPEENHLTILHNSVYRGLQLLYPEKAGSGK